MAQGKKNKQTDSLTICNWYFNDHTKRTGQQDYLCQEVHDGEEIKHFTLKFGKEDKY